MINADGYSVSYVGNADYLPSMASANLTVRRSAYRSKVNYGVGQRVGPHAEPSD